MNVFDEFEARGLVFDATEGLRGLLHDERVTVYIGFDPSAASLHVGSLLPIMGLARMQRFGHSPIAVVGGGTGLIGDPSGKTQERLLLTKEKVEENLQGIKSQLERFLDFSIPGNSARIINNADWLTKISLMDFLRDIGKHFTVNGMIAKESVKRRLEQADGISFTEFSYMLLQAYDFLELYDRHHCRLQMGGSDQWGNILAGTDLIRRLRGERSATASTSQEKSKALAHGLVFPLVTTASGVKFGKTEAGTIWLSPDLTSPFQFYQFWMNVDDRDVQHYLKAFTWLGVDAIGELAEAMQSAPEERAAQKALARAVTQAVHGETELAKAVRASGVLFGDAIKDLNATEIVEIFSDVPSATVTAEQLAKRGFTLIDLLVTAGLSSSKSDARRSIQGGGVYVNNVREPEEKRSITLDDAVDGQVIVVRRGRKDYRLVRVIGG